MNLFSLLFSFHGRIGRAHWGLGMAIVSTSRGLMTDRAARAQKVGGEVIGMIW